MSNTDHYKVTLPDHEDGEPGGWMLLRGKGRRFKAGERRALYEFFDTIKDRGKAIQELLLVRRMALHLVQDWSFDIPVPRVEVIAGEVSYAHAESLDELDVEAENELLRYAGEWIRQVSINFAPAKDPASPTSPSGA